MKDLARVLVSTGATVRTALECMTGTGKQVALVVDRDGRLLGLVTDGDVRKAILRGVSLESPIEAAMNRAPVTRAAGFSASEALGLMRQRSIRQLPLLDPEGKVVDLLFLDDLITTPPLPGVRAVIMAGGQGTRLRPYTDQVPKPLIRVGGRPLLEILIERLRQSGVLEMTVALHHKSGMIREHLGDGARLGVRVDYVEEPEPLGTMGALTLVAGGFAGPFFVVNGDILTKCDFRHMWESHRGRREAAMTVGVSLHQVEIPYGEFTLRDGRVTTIEEKPRKEFPINAGIYVIEPAVVELIPRGEYFDATDLIRLLLGRGRAVHAHVIREYWLDVGRHDDLRKADRDVAEGLLD
jgi:dTDP-glucose pyrophosphorylase